MYIGGIWTFRRCGRFAGTYLAPTKRPDLYRRNVQRLDVSPVRRFTGNLRRTLVVTEKVIGYVV